VARRYSTDAPTARRGGRFDEVEKGQMGPLLDRPVFRARRGKLLGPIKTPYGYYVVMVGRIRPASELPADQHREIVRETLQSEAEMEKLGAFVEEFTATWKARTVCSAAYDWHSDCGNWDGTEIKR
jgi:parvulin-like peptidyl-prolyl isomerase